MPTPWGEMPPPDFLPTFMPHQQQGSLDGACAFYCAAMILEYDHLADPAREVRDRRTRIARLLQRLAPQDPLLGKGLRPAQLRLALCALPLPQGLRLRAEVARAPQDRATLLRFPSAGSGGISVTGSSIPISAP